MDVRPRCDLLGELATAIQTTPHAISKYKQAPLKFGVYHLGYEWFNPKCMNTTRPIISRHKPWLLLSMDSMLPFDLGAVKNALITL
jgi:hypothetical protein